jgi:hypothetical protein
MYTCYSQMPPASDYTFARHASRRLGGTAFRLGGLPQRSNTNRSDHGNTKLGWSDVRQMRHFAQGAGFGMSIKDQADTLAPRFGVHAVTVTDVLRNLSWYDPAYDPKQPDPEIWGGLPPSVILLRLMA